MTGRDAVALFRGLLRARRKCFAGDLLMLKESRSQIRASFDQNRQVSDPSRLDQLFLEGQEAIHVFTNLIVQGKLNERGNYEIKPRMEHAGSTLEVPSPEATKCA
ncbi:hypothetical protein GOP47_0007808 [Adiantum capillus-veneris]|uniref:Complex 1 LYR protein domain-containing protein n=1 Tax=Adiantum capillus-veneris TaxID=13818 RepID=A0A9D4V1J5_ADICA|nr:hypothetical protein GOP47_0007808 [Adiantum capillus-veneris]